jgi:hypothetical protein
MRLPFKLIVEVLPWPACRAPLLKTPNIFMLPARAPPVILLVSVYWKSAKHAVEVQNRSAKPVAAATVLLIVQSPFLIEVSIMQYGGKSLLSSTKYPDRDKPFRATDAKFRERDRQGLVQ